MIEVTITRHASDDTVVGYLIEGKSKSQKANYAYYLGRAGYAVLEQLKTVKLLSDTEDYFEVTDIRRSKTTQAVVGVVATGIEQLARDVREIHVLNRRI